MVGIENSVSGFGHPSFSNQLHKGEGIDIQLDRNLGFNPSRNVGDEGESSSQQKQVKKADTKQADSTAGGQVGPSRFKFTFGFKDDPSVKESPYNLSKKEGSEQASELKVDKGRHLKTGRGGLESLQEKEMEVPHVVVYRNWVGVSFHRLEVCRDRVEQDSDCALDDEHMVRQQLSQALLMEEVMWKQKAYILWLAEGDKNTSFFHAIAKSRQTKCKIKSLECDGIEYLQSWQILELCTNYFKKVLTTDEAQGNFFEGLDNTATVTYVDNIQVLQPISEEEECWEMMKTEVMDARVMKCVTSVSYGVLMNGRMGEKFDRRRGLRQGDPLSLYIFLIVMEMFNRRLIKDTISKNIFVPKIRRVTTNGWAMLFADDVIMAAKATKKNMTTFKVILQDFECLAGMKVNVQKSMNFARTMVDCHMGEIQSIFPWCSRSLPSKYLGLPLFLGNLIEYLCLPLLTKVEKRLAGWKARPALPHPLCVNDFALILDDDF
ncbi:retrotransposable element ORF2 protein [Nymphaea thermarum]|nr:retrotransposable element ORF2 protein [Nymphaea thermarum]